MESYSLIVSGKVQHVYYRKSVSQAFMRMGLQGYIRNLADGTVEIVARIYEDELDRVIAVLNEGSPLSNVSGIVTRVLDEDDIVYDGFEIRK